MLQPTLRALSPLPVCPLPLSCLPHPPAKQVLKHTPLYVVTEEKVGLLGTREQAIRLAEELRADVTIAT